MRLAGNLAVSVLSWWGVVYMCTTSITLKIQFRVWVCMPALMSVTLN